MSTIGMTQFLGSVISTAGSTYFALGTLKTCSSTINLTQAVICKLISSGTNIPEIRKEGEDPMPRPLQAREWDIINQEGKELMKAFAFTVTGFTLLYLGKQIEGIAMQQTFLNSISESKADPIQARCHYTFKKNEFLPGNAFAEAFFSTLLMTSGDAIMGSATLSTLKSTINLLNAGFSIGYALTVKALEVKEEMLTGTVRVKQGDQMIEDTGTILANNLLSLPKTLFAAGCGAAMLAVGHNIGGISVSSIATKYIEG